ncbi:MAG: tyrosine-type recombinase/integrase [Peptoniphilus sp.]|uniref:tyrosine-type recombinase/integrase n=1 Tax=Peptoniphilus sp. TaxID=1971214 RepID=UPI002A7573A7|nr:tyrosine-type recombinase/integrase [Peptoniphilus sp.]MDY2986471.1 tyrosine-type recombinase/integrase [Peptoniphilus sp.]
MKNSNGEGTYYKYLDGWRGQISIGFDRFGKIVRKSATGKTKKEVRDKLYEIKKEYEGLSLDTNYYSVSQWLSEWLETYKKNSVTQTTYNVYERLIRDFLDKSLGDIPLRDLTTLDIQIAYNNMFANQKYSKSTIEQVHTKLKQSMKKAIEIKLIKENPCIGVELPLGRHKEKIIALTIDEQKKFIKRCEEEEYANFFVFMLATGLRIGEAAGLTWDMVDMTKKEITIKKIMIEIRGNPEFKEYPKTDAGLRTIPLNQKAYDILLERQKNNNEFNLLNLVFFSRTLNFRTTANARRYLHKLCIEANIRKINPHSLRHTYATRMIENNCNIKALSNMLGHAKISTTLDIYSDALIEYKRQQAATIDIF